MISEESCDSEDWSNDAENSAEHHRNKNFCIFNQTNTPFVDISDFIKYILLLNGSVLGIGQKIDSPNYHYFCIYSFTKK